MGRPVDLDDEFDAGRTKIDDEWRNLVLPAELYSTHLSAADVTPELNLVLRGCTAKKSRCCSQNQAFSSWHCLNSRSFTAGSVASDHRADAELGRVHRY